jgi:hypothetical protein
MLSAQQENDFYVPHKKRIEEVRVAIECVSSKFEGVDITYILHSGSIGLQEINRRSERASRMYDSNINCR